MNLIGTILGAVVFVAFLVGVVYAIGLACRELSNRQW